MLKIHILEEDNISSEVPTLIIKSSRYFTFLLLFIGTKWGAILYGNGLLVAVVLLIYPLKSNSVTKDYVLVEVFSLRERISNFIKFSAVYFVSSIQSSNPFKLFRCRNSFIFSLHLICQFA